MNSEILQFQAPFIFSRNAPKKFRAKVERRKYSKPFLYLGSLFPVFSRIPGVILNPGRSSWEISNIFLTLVCTDVYVQRNFRSNVIETWEVEYPMVPTVEKHNRQFVSSRKERTESAETGHLRYAFRTVINHCSRGSRFILEESSANYAKHTVLDPLSSILKMWNNVIRLCV